MDLFGDMGDRFTNVVLIFIVVGIAIFCVVTSKWVKGGNPVKKRARETPEQYGARVRRNETSEQTDARTRAGDHASYLYRKKKKDAEQKKRDAEREE